MTKPILHFLLLLGLLSQTSFADEYDFSDVSLKLQRNNVNAMDLTFTLNDIPTEDFPNGTFSDDNAWLLLIQNLDICLNADSCNDVIPWRDRTEDDNTPEDEFIDNYFIQIVSITETKDPNRDEYDMIVAVTIVSEPNDQDPTNTADSFSTSTVLTLNYENDDIDERVSVTATQQVPVSTFPENVTSQQNLELSFLGSPLPTVSNLPMVRPEPMLALRFF